jgi:hypothetical protein
LRGREEEEEKRMVKGEGRRGEEGALLVSVDGAEEGDVVVQSLHHVLVQSIFLELNRLGSGLGVGAELGDHRVVVHADHAALEDAGVDADSALRSGVDLGLLVGDERADGGQELSLRVLGVDTTLDGVAVEGEGRVLGEALRKRLASADPQHVLHQILAGDHLCDRVLHL